MGETPYSPRSVDPRMMEFRPPVTLDARYVQLVPLVPAHARPLALVGTDPEIWRWMRYGYLGNPEAMSTVIEELLGLQAKGTDLAFTILLKPSLAPVGMTRYLGIDRENQVVEVGGTWLAPTLWRTPVNTDSKRAMLSNAFDHEGCERVQLKTDVRNIRSQRAIERLGAVREGILRHHIRLRDGTYRDSVIYGIVRSEWPEVRRRLDEALQQPWTPPAAIP